MRRDDVMLGGSLLTQPREGGETARVDRDEDKASALADPATVRAFLIAAARERSALTYAELLGMLGYGFSRPKMRSLCRVLDAVDADCAGRGEPELAVLVVRQSDGLPGQGWWVGGGAREHGFEGSWEGPEAAALVARVQAAAFDHWATRIG